MRQLEDSNRSGADTRKPVEDLQAYLGILGRGWRLIAIGILLALGASFVYFAWLNPSYRASTRLLLIQQGGRRVQVAGGGDPFLESGSEPNELLATHLLILQSPMIAEEAIKAKNLQQSISVEALVKGLKVRLPDSAAKVIDLSFAAATSDDARSVVDAVVLSYNEFLKDNYQEHSKKVITLFAAAKDDLSNKLQELEKEYLQYRSNNPAYSADEKGRSFLVRRLDQWDQAMNQVLTRSLQLKSQLELGQKLAKEGADATSIANALNQVGVLGGGGVVTTLNPQGSPDSGERGLSLEKLGEELASLEIQRKTAEKVLENLQGEQEGTKLSGSALDRALSTAFYQAPDVADLQAELVKARQELERTKRVARSASEPALAALRRHVKDLESELSGLWQERRPVLEKTLGRQSNGELAATIQKAEGTLLTLRARESALREQLSVLVADRVDGLRREHADLKQRGVGDNHPQVQQIQSQIAKLQGQTERRLHLPGDDKSASLLASIRESLNSIEALRKDLQTKFEEDLKKSKETEISQLAENNLRNNLERQKMLFYSVVDQLKQAELASEFGSVRTQAISPTMIAADRPNLAVILLFAILVGCGLGGVAAFVVDFLDARVRTVPEVRRLLDLSVIGVVPQLSPAEVGSVKVVGLLTHSIPRSALAETYKAARTTLEFIQRSRQARVLMITSPNPGDGKSTTASNLAITLARAGRRVLLIDADLRRSVIHTFYDLSRENGLADVLEGQGEIFLPVHQTVVFKLDVMPSGVERENPAELLASDRLNSLLEEARRAYDVVIVDTSPLLAVTDPSIVAASVDGIILVVRLGATRRLDIDRTNELVRTLGIPVIGTVVNGVSKGDLAQGYGYHYGYASPDGGVYGTNGVTNGKYALERSVTIMQAVDGNAEIGAQLAEAIKGIDMQRPRGEQS
jgi:capsular exopolysaccharide synthesis family protein